MPSRRRQKSARAELRMDVAQAVVPRMPPPSFIFASPGREVELVVHDEDLVRRDPEETRQRRDDAAGERS